MPRIQETQEFGPLSVFYRDNGLEIEISDRAPEGTIKSWKCEDEESGTLLAAATLQLRDECYVLSDLAVKEELRGTGLGKRLLELAEGEARALGAEEIWLVGKVPAFYRRFAWKEVPRETAPDISRCQTCDSFGKTCFPSIMKKVF